MSTEQIRERLEEKRRAIDTALEVIDELQEPKAPVDVWVAPEVTVAEVAKAVLTEGGPMRTKPLAEAIQRRGFKTRSKNFYPVVYKAMRTHEAFEKTPAGWNLRKAS